ncbi:mycothiol synthase [Bacillus sp. SORGH_AS 510]|uniref:GNAT family N-acetyltransferase n=1 Tax=Bacillus sp. SORGH_AS_0510 TaxID=3041771 RepID=UPI00278A4677|nr:GNAT family N-acetyltransferase [Bacillus sp. SORGH_AS_0510]MDQ1146171.1 mycothiol synthase [Bacillus sp. SORGH_AS_0510]
MKVEYLCEERVADFVAYCKNHKIEIDDSFLYDEHLANFKPDKENPTYIVTNQKGRMVAVGSLMLNDYNRRGRKARFRIFHSEEEHLVNYQMLMQELLRHTNEIDEVFLFVPFTNEKLAHTIELLKFLAERYTFLLVRGNEEVPKFSMLDGYEIRPFRLGMDEEAWCTVRNAAFANLKGSETPITPDMVVKMMTNSDHIEGASLILFDKERPVGVIRGAVDEYEDAPIMNIGPIAIVPEYQGKGLGRFLLRYLLDFANRTGYDRTILCVNAENERAKALYIQEGFKQVEGVTCYTFRL